MSQNNLDEINRELEQMSDLLNKFGSTSGTASSGNSILAKAQSDLNIAEKKNQENKKQLLKTLGTLGGDLRDTISSIKTADGSFTSLNPVIDITTKVTGSFASMIPFVGTALKSIAEGAGEVAKFLTESFEKAYSSFEKLSGSGILTTFEELTQTSRNSGLSYNDLEKILSTNSTRMSVLGGTALKGRNVFEYVTYSTKEAKENFRKLGMTAVEFADIQVKYMEMQQLSSINQKTDWTITSKESVEYIKNLNVLSALTGESREELQKKQMDMANDPRYQATVNSLEKENAEQVRDLISMLSAIDPAMAEGLKDVIASAGNPITDAGKSVAYMMAQMGIDTTEFSRSITKGTLKSDQALNMFKKNSKRYIQTEKYLAAQIGKNNLTTRNFAGAVKLATLTDKDYVKIREEENNRQSQILKDDKSKNAQLANTANSFYRTQIMMQDMALSSDTMTLVMEKMASGVETVVEKLHSSLGKELPPYMKARKQEKTLIDELSKEKKKLAELQERYENLSRQRLRGPADAVKKDLTRQQGIVSKRQSELTSFQSQNAQVLGIPQAPTPSSASGTTGGAPSAAPPTTSSGSTTAPTSPSTPAAIGDSSDSQSSSSQPGAPKAGESSGGGNKGIAVIRDLIASVESIGGSYDSLFGKGTSVPVSTMTISQVLNTQRELKRNGAKSTAAGRYQFMDYTLPEYAAKAKFNFDTTLFNQQNQDTLADILIREKGYDRYKSGQLSAKDFLNNLSRAWAGLPSPQKGGASFYAGDGLNRSHITIEKALAAIGQAKTGGIFSGPDSGYLAMLHGTEAVVSGGEGGTSSVSKRALNSSAINSGKGTGENLNDLLRMITSKVQNMITVVDSGMSKQKKIMRNSMV